MSRNAIDWILPAVALGGLFFLLRNTPSAAGQSVILRSLPPGTKLALLGDSYGVGLDPTLKQLAAEFSVPFFDSVVGGTSATQWALDSWLAPVLAFGPNVALVSLGANDFQRTDGDKVRAAIHALCTKLRAAGARVLWISPLAEPFADNNRVLETWRAEVNYEFRSSDLQLPRAADGIHSTPGGYAAWATSVWDWVATTLATLPRTS
jgi:lysophospholipase L1-like esterase